MRAQLPAADYDEVFPPRPSSRCGWCDYQRSCPEGQQAAAPHRPWDALAELSDPARDGYAVNPSATADCARPTVGPTAYGPEARGPWP